MDTLRSFRQCRPYRIAGLAALAMVASGCASAPATGDTPGTCSDAGLAWAVGQQADEPVMRRLARESGAGLVNPIGPDSRVLADSRGDRLRVYIDRDNVIEKAVCE